MAKQYITERDIEDLAARGQGCLKVTENLKLTDLAIEKAHQLGIKLLQPDSFTFSTSLKPDLPGFSTSTQSHSSIETARPFDEAIRVRIRSAVKAKLGDQIDPELLDTIITRVLFNIGMG